MSDGELKNVVVVKVRIWLKLFLFVVWGGNFFILINRASIMISTNVLIFTFTGINILMVVLLFWNFLLSDSGTMFFLGIISDRKIVWRLRKNKLVAWKDEHVVVYNRFPFFCEIGFKISGGAPMFNQLMFTNFDTASKVIYTNAKNLSDEDRRLLIRYGNIDHETVFEFKNKERKKNR